MDREFPALAQPALTGYLTRLDQAAPGLLEGFYLHGSIALGAFIAGKSDIDFVAVTGRRCTADDMAALRSVHEALARQFPGMPLEGGYLQWSDLGGSEATIAPHPHFHDGVLHEAGYHDINDVTWWVLKYKGIALRGKPVDQLNISIDWDGLIDRMQRNMKDYWARFTTDPRRIAWLYADFGVEWTVLGVLRQYYTFRERAITSKIGAGRYALDHTPARWHRLIREAIAIREGAGKSSYDLRLARALDAYLFLRAIIAACNRGSSAC